MKGLIFDSDGTLFDIEKFIPVFAEIMREAYHSCTGDRMKFTNGECYKALQLPVLESCKLLRSGWGLDPEKYWRVVFELDRSIRNRVLGDKIKPFRDIYVLKRLAQKYQLGVLANTPEPIVEYQLRYFKMRNMFKAVVCGFYKSDMCKPETKGLRLCLERMGLKARDVAIIGDSDLDVAVGKELGAVTIKIIRGQYDYGGPDPDFTIKSLKELEALFK